MDLGPSVKGGARGPSGRGLILHPRIRTLAVTLLKKPTIPYNGIRMYVTYLPAKEELDENGLCRTLIAKLANRKFANKIPTHHFYVA